MRRKQRELAYLIVLAIVIMFVVVPVATTGNVTFSEWWGSLFEPVPEYIQESATEDVECQYDFALGQCTGSCDETYKCEVSYDQFDNPYCTCKPDTSYCQHSYNTETGEKCDGKCPPGEVCASSGSACYCEVAPVCTSATPPDCNGLCDNGKCIATYYWEEYEIEIGETITVDGAEIKLDYVEMSIYCTAYMDLTVNKEDSATLYWSEIDDERYYYMQGTEIGGLLIEPVELSYDVNGKVIGAVIKIAVTDGCNCKDVARCSQATYPNCNGLPCMGNGNCKVNYDSLKCVCDNAACMWSNQCTGACPEGRICAALAKFPGCDCVATCENSDKCDGWCPQGWECESVLAYPENYCECKDKRNILPGFN